MRRRPQRSGKLVSFISTSYLLFKSQNVFIRNRSSPQDLSTDFSVNNWWTSPSRWSDLIQEPVGSTAGAIDAKPHFPQWSDVIDLHVESVLLTALEPVVEHIEDTEFMRCSVRRLFLHNAFFPWRATCPHSSAAASPPCCRWLRIQTWRSGCLFLRPARPPLLR